MPFLPLSNFILIASVLFEILKYSCYATVYKLPQRVQCGVPDLFPGGVLRLLGRLWASRSLRKSHKNMSKGLRSEVRSSRYRASKAAIRKVLLQTLQ